MPPGPRGLGRKFSRSDRAAGLECEEGERGARKGKTEQFWFFLGACGLCRDWPRGHKAGFFNRCRLRASLNPPHSPPPPPASAQPAAVAIAWCNRTSGRLVWVRPAMLRQFLRLLALLLLFNNNCYYCYYYQYNFSMCPDMEGISSSFLLLSLPFLLLFLPLSCFPSVMHPLRHTHISGPLFPLISSHSLNNSSEIAKGIFMQDQHMHVWRPCSLQ